MRQLCDAKNVGRSLVAAAVVTVLCGTYLHTKTANLDVANPLLVFVFGVLLLSFMIWQMAAGWTPDEIRARSDALKDRRVVAVVAATLALAAAGFFVDSWMAEQIRGYCPVDLREFIVTLPFRATFQALIVIVFPYAVATRLIRNPTAVIVTVVGFAELLAVLKMKEAAAPVVAVYLIVAGVIALVLALAYRLGGILALAICAGLFYSRFLIHLM
jgi:hypothetical protein